MRKVVILGPSGSGKTTLGLKISNSIGAKSLHLDGISFNKGWIMKPVEDIIDTLGKFLLQNDSWVIDGNWRKLLFERRLEECDTIIYLDYGLEVSKEGVYERYARFKGKPRPDVPQCIDSIDDKFEEYLESYEEVRGKAIKARIIEMSSVKQVHVFKTREEANSFFNLK